MINQIKENIWQIRLSSYGSCMYFIKLNNQKIIIDTGYSINREEIIENLKQLKTKPSEIDILILTHDHPDHVGNIDLFENAKIYASKKDFPSQGILDIILLNIPEFQIIETPGHTKGGICILYEDVLFSGDTIFHNRGIGRMDLPGGSEKEMSKSLQKLKSIDYKILCPGHI
ncbi:MAG: MBL fold metallo-hydrolase [archaeon]